MKNIIEVTTEVYSTEEEKWKALYLCSCSTGFIEKTPPIKSDDEYKRKYEMYMKALENIKSLETMKSFM